MSIHYIDVSINQNLRLNNQTVAVVEQEGQLYFSLFSLLDIYNQSAFYSLETLRELLDYVESSSCIKAHNQVFLPDYSVIWLFNQLENSAMSRIIFKVIQRLKFNWRQRKALNFKIQGVKNRCFV
jgi:hypothetical protein